MKLNLVFDSLKKFGISIVFISLVSCASTNKRKEMKIINLRNDLVSFWKEAKNKDHEKRVNLWNEVIEQKYPYLYSNQVWRSESRKGWKDFKAKKLKETFSYYDSSFEKVVDMFDSFNETLSRQMSKYSKLFPGSDFSNTPIVVLPSAMTFNGRGGSHKDYPDVPVLYMGIDFISQRNDNIDILYSHELFHIYHVDRMKVNEEVFLKKGKMTLPLWLEGFATWVSGEFNEDGRIDELLMDDNFESIDKKILRSVSLRFLQDADKLVTADKMNIYQSWFNMDQPPVINGLPSRLGYFLGYFVVDEIAKKNDIKDMVFWDHERVHKEVVSALQHLK